MGLGDAFEISLSVGDVERSTAIYSRFGFRPSGETPGEGLALSDGTVNLGLYTASFPSPTLTFYVDDLPAWVRQLTSIGVDACILGAAAGAEVPNPHRIRMRLVEVLDLPGPAATPSPSPLGEFGELAFAVEDLQPCAAFWQKLGFEKIAGDDEPRLDPEPWAVFRDGAALIGLRQTADFAEPHLTYVSPDSAARTAALKSAGVGIERKDSENATIVGPGGLRFFVFAE